jgi:hypothetical protein
VMLDHRVDTGVDIGVHGSPGSVLEGAEHPNRRGVAGPCQVVTHRGRGDEAIADYVKYSAAS